MFKKIILGLTMISAALLVLLLNTTTPVSAGPFGILMLFLCAYLFSLGVVTFLLTASSRLITHLSIVFTVKRPLERLSFKRSYYYATVIAAAPVMLIGLQSVGSIGINEFLLILLFVIIGCLYITKRIR